MTRPEPITVPAPIAVLVSGAGSNLQALAEAIATGALDAVIVGVFCDVPDAPAVERATRLGLPVTTVAFDRADRHGWEERLAAAVAESGAELVVLAGFMRVLTGRFLGRWPDRVINVHPSLLPAFRGARAVEDALAAGVRVTGVTVHLFNELVDHGPILAQEALEVDPADTVESVRARLHPIEHRLLPRCVAALAAGQVQLQDGRAVIIEPAAVTDPAVGRARIRSQTDAGPRS
jgi:phosphoribosylglycinamide formyltransferase 1